MNLLLSLLISISVVLCAVSLLIVSVEANPNPEFLYWQNYYRRNLETMTLQYRYELNALKLGLHERDFTIMSYRNNIESLESTVSFQRQIIQFLTRRLEMTQHTNKYIDPEEDGQSDVPISENDEYYYDASENQPTQG